MKLKKQVHHYYYYVRRLIETDELIVEKSQIFDKDEYVVDVAQRSEDPFELVSPSTSIYKDAVQEFILSENPTQEKI